MFASGDTRIPFIEAPNNVIRGRDDVISKKFSSLGRHHYNKSLDDDLIVSQFFNCH